MQHGWLLMWAHSPRQLCMQCSTELNALKANGRLCSRRYQGHVSAALVLGGVDLHGPHLLTVRQGGRALRCSPRSCRVMHPPSCPQACVHSSKWLECSHAGGQLGVCLGLLLVSN